MIQDRDALLQELRDNLAIAQGRMQNSTNNKRRDVEFSVGE